jgi:hypothetical protein
VPLARPEGVADPSSDVRAPGDAGRCTKRIGSRHKTEGVMGYGYGLGGLVITILVILLILYLVGVL